MKFTVDRETWLRGEGPSDSYLLRGTDRNMCCLGFLAKACAYSDADIIGSSAPSTVAVLKGVNNFPKSLVELTGSNGLVNSMLCLKIMKANDRLSDDEDESREEKLTRLFKEADIEVEFIN